MTEKLLLLLVQSQADVDALPSACQTILAHGYSGVWVLHSPAIAVDVKTAAAQFDREIEDLRIAKRAAAERDDFQAADGHRLKIEEKLLDRGKVVNDAWRNLSQDERTKAYTEKFAPIRGSFEKRINCRLTCLQDHFEPDQWILMLNSLSGAWFAPFKAGSFSVAWPTAIPDAPTPQIRVETPIPATQPTPEQKREFSQAVKKSEPKEKPIRQFASREEELMKKPHLAIRALGKSLNVQTDGRPRADVVKDLLAAESAVAA